MSIGPTPEFVDQHLDSVLRASGSALRYYSLPSVLSAMRSAMLEAMRAAVRSTQLEEEARAAVEAEQGATYCHPPEEWVNHPSGRAEPWCSKCEASPTRNTKGPDHG